VSNDHFYIALILLLAAAPMLFVVMEDEFLGAPIPEEGEIASRGIRAPFDFLYDGRGDVELIRSRYVPKLDFDEESYEQISDGIHAMIFSPGTSKLGLTDEGLMPY